MLTPAQIATLHSELSADPSGKGYAALLPASPGSVVDLLNAPTETMVKAIKTTTAQAWAATGPYSAIVDAASNLQHPCRASCLVLRDSFASGVDIHLERADMQNMLAGWVSASLITAAQRDDLVSRATQSASRMEKLGLPAATINDVIGAM
ncbi:MAG TPA: hypothetical protein VFW00_07190 [Rhodocyclaceae bacterium]|nr:hypothetical protein [Rhodocyclaceae bacterium]